MNVLILRILSGNCKDKINKKYIFLSIIIIVKVARLIQITKTIMLIKIIIIIINSINKNGRIRRTTKVNFRPSD